MGLYDAAMIKENHIAWTDNLKNAVQNIRLNSPFTTHIIIEAENIEQAKEAELEGADSVLLDELSPEIIKQTVQELRDLSMNSLKKEVNKNLIINHINNRSNSENTSKLIKYDSIHGKLNADLDYDLNHLIINKNKITFSQETKIEDINWKKHDVDYVFECTGKFNSKEKLLAHLENGAKKVIVSAPCKNADKTIVFGVNENIITKEDKIISAASCTTNCLAPVISVLDQNFEIEKGFMTTIHAFTNDQRILDNSHKDPRRARSASQSIVPTSTGASKAIGEIIPNLKGKLEGVAMRVPTPNVSLIELVFCTKKNINIKIIKM